MVKWVLSLTVAVPYGVVVLCPPLRTLDTQMKDLWDTVQKRYVGHKSVQSIMSQKSSGQS